MLDGRRQRGFNYTHMLSQIYHSLLTQGRAGQPRDVTVPMNDILTQWIITH